jgi:hypothetical protein
MTVNVADLDGLGGADAILNVPYQISILCPIKGDFQESPAGHLLRP